MSRRNQQRKLGLAGVLKLVGLIFVVIGGLFTLGAAGIAVETWLYVNSAQSTVGTVVGLDRANNRGTQIIVQYQTNSGQTIEARPGIRTNPPMAQVGEVVKLYYQANNPSDVRLNNFVNLWLLPTIFGTIGLIFLLVGSGLTVAGLIANAKTRAAAAAQI